MGTRLPRKSMGFNLYASLISTASGVVLSQSMEALLQRHPRRSNTGVTHASSRDSALLSGKLAGRFLPLLKVSEWTW